MRLKVNSHRAFVRFWLWPGHGYKVYFAWRRWSLRRAVMRLYSLEEVKRLNELTNYDGTGGPPN